jgi:hypothetical protein
MLALENLFTTILFRDLFILCPNTCIVFKVINALHQRGTFVTTDEPTWRPHFHPMSILY